MKTITLYRPVGITELGLIADSNWSAFPPRLDWQPIFYPVLNQAYAAQIAREWNTEDAFSGYCGIITRFTIDEAYCNQFSIENVGGAAHNELWVPAAELATFNRHITGKIAIVAAFFGAAFEMPEQDNIREELLKFR